MADESKFNYIDSLNADQLANYNLVFDTAKSMGLNPLLATAIAYRESKFNQFKGDDILRGDAGEIGMMQVKPGTAKQMGYKADELKDPQKNVRIGLEYLQQNLDRYGNPKLAVIAYNAGPDTPFLKGESDEPPSVDYVNKIAEYGGFDPYVSPEDKAAQAEKEKQPVEVSDQDYQRSLATGAIGAGAGASLGTAQVAKGAAADILSNLRGKAASTGATGGEKWAQNWAGQNRPGASVPEAAAAYQRSKGQGLITGKQTQMWGPKGPGEPASLVDRLIQRGQTAEQASSPLGKAGAILKSPIVSKGLAGAGAGFSGNEALTRYQAGDYPGAAIAGAGALGSLASMVPHPVTRAVGTAAGMASPAALMVLDKMRRASPEQTQRALSNVDAMGNPLP